MTTENTNTQNPAGNVDTSNNSEGASQITSSNNQETLLAGKYKTIAELEAAYKNINADYTKKSQELAALKKTEEVATPDSIITAEDANTQENTQEEKTDTTTTTTEDVTINEETIKDVKKTKAALESKGLDFNELTREFAQQGKLSDDTYKMLEGKGIPKDFTDKFIANQQKLVDISRQELSKAIGGTEELTKTMQWAKDNLTDAQKIDINSVRDEYTIQLILKDLNTQRLQSEGITPNYVNNTSSSGGSTDIFESQAQMFEALNDRKYRTDPAFEAKVTAKIRRSREAGIQL